jgi:F-type H+-transporting ATPase subunit a
MITNLFSIFDPMSRIISISINWLRSFIGILFIPTLFWIIPSRNNLIWVKIINNLHKEFKILINSPFNGRTLIIISLFRLILFNNLLGLMPYVFTRTSHIVISISISLPLWISFMAYGWFKNYQHIFTHLVPQGTPSALMSFIVCIETVRNLIRPWTLAIRLTANIIAGHLLLTLLGNTGSYIINYILILLLITQIILLLLETAVAIIQSYVFSVLRTLYSREVT